MFPEFLHPGARLGAYSILAHLGSGGMGDVYLASDERLGRRVALKVLQPELALDAGVLRRFEREARAASALNHPSILTIYELGQVDGVLFIAGEYIEGETLRAVLERGPLPIAEAVRIAMQVASALSVAHAAGIVHRDVKPENVMIRSDGLVKVLDFGLAKLVAPRDSDKTVERTTQAGVAIGTVLYMSPEQARGQMVDERSDIFSFGSMLYELVTGAPPFDGETFGHIMVAILERDPVPPTHPGLQRIITKALQKDPFERYQTMSALLDDLRTVDTAEPLAPPPPRRVWQRISRRTAIATIAALAGTALTAAGVFTAVRMLERPPASRIPIAVADFDNRTGDKTLDGLSGMLITSLEQSRRLSVMSRARMFDVLHRLGRGDATRIDETLGRDVSRAENVHGLVIASVSRFGSVYVVDLKVLDPATNEYLFTVKEQARGLEAVPEVVDKLSEQVRLGLDEAEEDVRAARTQIRAATTPNLEAYQHYFQGEQYVAKLDFTKARDEFRAAVQRDPTFAMAWYRVANAEEWLGRMTAAHEAIAHAVANMEGLPRKEKLIIRSGEASSVGDYERVIALRKEILMMTPNDKETLFIIGDYSFHAGHRPQAIDFLRRVLRIDPTHEPAHQHLAWSLRDEGRYREFLDETEAWTKRFSTPEAWMLHAQALKANDRPAEAIQAATQLRDDDKQARYFLLPAYVRLETGDVAGALRDAEAALASPESHRQFAAQHLRAVAAVREGRMRDAIKLYDAAVAAAPIVPGASIPERMRAERAVVLAIAGNATESRAVTQRLFQSKVEVEDEVWANVINAHFEMSDIELPKAVVHAHFRDVIVANKLVEGYDKLFAGDPEAALVAFRRVAAALAIRSNAVARAALEAGRYDEARAAALHARATARPGFYGALDNALLATRLELILARCDEAQGYPQGARERYLRILDIGPRADPGVEPFATAKARLAGR